MTNAGERMNRQMLQVVGLNAGDYKLLVDGKLIGEYSYNELAKGIGLQDNKDMPDYQQAMKVAELNKERNDKAIQPLRDLWIELKFRRYRETEGLEKEEEEWIKDDMSVQEWKEKVFYKKAEELEKKAKEFEDKVYEINKPVAHKYELIKI
jgi:hypothetical protein